eukprot:11026-Heterococcus_DN1.PRE.4
MDVEDEQLQVVYPEQKDVDQFWKALRTLHWEELTCHSLTLALRAVVCKRVRTVTEAAQNTEPVLTDLLAWQDGALRERLGAQLQDDADVDPEAELQVDTLQARLRDMVLRAYIAELGRQVFLVVRDYPDTAPAVDDLKQAIALLGESGTGSKEAAALITQELRKAMFKRLLQMGAETSSIIAIYIAMIKALRHLDPSDALLEACAGPVRAYLQGRRDTIKCVVASLTDTTGDLYEEIRRQQGAKPLEQVSKRYINLAVMYAVVYAVQLHAQAVRCYRTASEACLMYATEEGDDEEKEDGPGKMWMPIRRDAPPSRRTSPCSYCIARAAV